MDRATLEAMHDAMERRQLILSLPPTLYAQVHALAVQADMPLADVACHLLANAIAALEDTPSDGAQ